MKPTEHNIINKKNLLLNILQSIHQNMVNGKFLLMAATTGPNIGPRPTSSTPAIRINPRARAARSSLKPHTGDFVIHPVYKGDFAASILGFRRLELPLRETWEVSHFDFLIEA